MEFLLGAFCYPCKVGSFSAAEMVVAMVVGVCIDSIHQMISLVEGEGKPQKIIAVHVYDKGLMFRTYEEHL